MYILQDGMKIHIPSNEEAAAHQKRLSSPPQESRKEQINIRLSAQVRQHCAPQEWQMRIDNRLRETVTQV